jgi:hypothetical protein
MDTRRQPTKSQALAMAIAMARRPRTDRPIPIIIDHRGQLVDPRRPNFPA